MIIKTEDYNMIQDTLLTDPYYKNTYNQHFDNAKLSEEFNSKIKTELSIDFLKTHLESKTPPYCVLKQLYCIDNNIFNQFSNRQEINNDFIIFLDKEFKRLGLNRNSIGYQYLDRIIKFTDEITP